ncbi:MAG: hypothetical protein MUF81_12715 [Verrucomicrobia bacterium]|jgi:hypothetical protein|nr:hypothetical protein [Verrucomicrobiota bacterium]
MTWLKKKSDPLSERARALNSEIAALEVQIKHLDATLSHSPPRKPSGFRSTAVPHGVTITHATQTADPLPAAPAPPPPAPKINELIFEEVGQEPLKPRGEPATTPEHYNELGVRKYDFTALIHWINNLFRRPTTMNPRLVSYLAAGGVHGLQPLRKEKRVARNRFIIFVVVLFFLLLGIIWKYGQNR